MNNEKLLKEVSKIPQIESHLDNIALIPNKLNAEIDYTNALKRCLNLMDSNNGGVIKIPQGITIDFSEIEITKKNIKITGGGRLKGKIILNSTDNQQFNFSIENVILESPIPIEVRKGRRFKINNCVFENCDKAIYINPSINAPFHSIAMANICHNEFIDVNYALYGEKYDGAIDLQVNDFIFADNTINKAYISHIYLKEVDGIVIHNNTMFFPSYDQLNNTKQYNVYIGSADWVVISGNNLFESGYESILLENCKHPTVSDNNIAWCGQRKPSSAIKINSTSDFSSYFKITDNNISKSTSNGVDIVNCKYGDVKDNVIEVSLVNNPFYYGNIDLSTIQHLGLYIDNPLPIGSLKIDFENTVLNTKPCNKELFIDFENLKKDINTNGTILNCEGVKQLNLVQPNANLVTNIEGAYNGKQITLIAFNGNTSLKYDSNIMLLKDGINASIPFGATITLEYYANKWYEISRSFETSYYWKYKSIDITDTRTSLDTSLSENFNLAQPSSTTITTISNGVNGKEISILAFNGNTTIQHNASTLRLKGGVNATIPNNGIIQLKYYANSWYETCRNF